MKMYVFILVYPKNSWSKWLNNSSSLVINPNALFKFDISNVLVCLWLTHYDNS